MRRLAAPMNPSVGFQTIVGMGMVVLSLLLATKGAIAFSIDFHSFGTLGLEILHDGPPVHETITVEIIRDRPDGPSTANLIEHIKRGLQNTDYTHQFGAEYHFDNSTPLSSDNGGLSRGFARIQADLEQAIETATDNPLFLAPLHRSFQDIAANVHNVFVALTVDRDCLGSPACPSALIARHAVELGLIIPLFSQVLNRNPDPHIGAYSGPIRRIQEMVKEALTGCRGKICPGLTLLQQEIRAYYGWHHLGHAFHTTQDFFAHSNYVELMGGKDGPPCWPLGLVLEAGPCGTKITNPDADFILVPTEFEQFNESGLRTIMGNKWQMLQTGYVGGSTDDHCGGKDGNTLPNTNAPPGYQYCHWHTRTMPGLNKDEPGEEEPAHMNHQYARAAAKKVSAALWEYFLKRIGQAGPPCPFGGRYDGANCFIMNSPADTDFFEHHGNYYYQGVLQGNPCPHQPLGLLFTFNGNDCMYIVDQSVSPPPVVLDQNLYYQAISLIEGEWTCPYGGTLSFVHEFNVCLLMEGVWSDMSIIYYHSRIDRTCPYQPTPFTASFDGSNCLIKLPLGAQAFIHEGNLYYKACRNCVVQ
jgi:hypothetical protein